MVKELPKNQLKPAAQPVSKFLSFRSQQPAAPAQPQQLPGVKGVNIIQRGNVQNVQGYNNFTEWSQSIKQVTGAFQAGMQVYKSVQEREGKNQVDKAFYNLQQQQLQSGQEWTETQRKVAREDLEAALMMDQVNPYRRIAMEKRLSQLAGLEVNGEMSRQYNAAQQDIIGLDPADQRVNAIKANVVNVLSDKYLLNENSAGFVDHFLPAVNESWFRVSDNHMKANTKFFKYKQEAQTKFKLFKTIENFISSNSQDYAALPLLLGEVLNEEAMQLGLPLEPTQFNKNVLVSLVGEIRASDLGNKDEIIDYIAMIPMGQKKNKKGQAETTYAGDWFRTEMILEDTRISNSLHNKSKKEFEINKQNFIDKWQDAIIGKVKGTPEYREAIKEAREDAINFNLGRAEATVVFAEIDVIDTNDAIYRLDPSRVDELYARSAGELAINWDFRKVKEELNLLFAGSAPDGYGEYELSEYYRKSVDEFARLNKRKQDEIAGGSNSTMVRSSIADVVETRMKSYNASIDILNAQIKEKNPELIIDDKEWRKNRDVILSQTESGIKTQYYKKVSNAIRDYQAKEGKISLSDDELQVILSKEEADFNQNYDEYMNGYIPEIPTKKNPSYVQSGDGSVSSKPVQKTFPRSATVHPRFIENEAWKSQPIYSEEDNVKLIKQLIESSGSLKAISTAVKNTANTAGVNPAEFIFQHAEIHYPDIKIDPENKKKILQKTNGVYGLQSSIRRSSPLGGALSISTNYMNALLTGEAPRFRSIS